MNHAAVFVFVAGLVVTVASCGRFLEQSGSDPNAVDAGSSSGGEDAADASTASDFVVVTTDAAAARKPPACPLAECPGDPCKDEDCDDDLRDFQPTGAFERDTAAGTCKLTTNGPSNAMFYSEVRPAPRTYAVLGLQLLELTADRTIAKLSSVGAPPDGERIIVRRRNGAFEICEQNASGTRCSEPLGVVLPQTLQVFGIVTSEDPPRATFALGTNANDCAALKVIDVTDPFPQGNLRAEVGCLDDGGPCTLRFDNAILFVRPE